MLVPLLELVRRWLISLGVIGAIAGGLFGLCVELPVAYAAEVKSAQVLANQLGRDAQIWLKRDLRSAKHREAALLDEHSSHAN